LTPFVDADPERLAAMGAGDVTAPVLLTAAFVPQLLTAVNGFNINVASVSAYLPQLGWGQRQAC
jgi:short-subunit dehydrogenase